jgi:serine/threonine protein kinase
LTEEVVVLGGYRRVNVMQMGQNSEVWQVVDAASGRQTFAMKLLLPERNDDPVQRRMLRHEARLGLKLEHPKIIRTIKYGTDKKTPFIIMEYFSGSNVKLRMMRGQFDKFLRPRMRSILNQVSQGLDFLHTKNWVHRDVKPDNILVDTVGQVKLIDFALATKSATWFARRFARRGSTMGTRSYMSPEQIRGLPVDRRADIYSLGVVIFELVNGRLPFVGRTAAELLRKHINDPPPSWDPTKGATPEFEALVRRMLAKKEKDRVQDLNEFQSRLRNLRLFKDEKDEETGDAARKLA